MSKQLKQWMAGDLRARLEASPDLLVVGLLPLDAEKTTALRRTLREQGATLRVVHNRTARHALPGPAEGLTGLFRGQTAVALGGEPVPLAKALLRASREKQLELRGGLVDGELLDAQGVAALAASPDRATLRAQLLSAVLGPGRGLAVALQAAAAGLARCLEQRAGAEDGGPATETTG